MEIQIKLEKDDWIKYRSYIERELCQQAKPRLNSFWTSFFIFMLIGSLFTIAFQFIYKLHMPTLGFVAVLLFLTGSLFMWNMIKIKKAYAPSEHGIFIGEHNFVVDNDGIRSRGKGYHSQLSWSIVKKIVRSDGMVLIFLDTVHALVFPEEKLQTPDEFYSYINRQFSGLTR